MHPLLARQLKRLQVGSPDTMGAGEIAELINVVSRSYFSADEDRLRLERSLEVSSREMEERTREITRLAFHDKLTGLPNRALLFDRLKWAITKIARTKGNISVIFFDLDSFKAVNDQLGHETGDEILKGVAERLATILSPGDTSARLGGDEFLVLLEEPHSPGDAIKICKRIVTVIGLPFETSRGICCIGASAGICTTSDPEVDVSELVKQADAAMYTAKASGKNRVATFDPSRQAAANSNAA